MQAERDLDALVRTPPRVATGGEKAGHVIALVELALRDLPANDRGRFARPLPVPEHQPQFAAAAPQSAGPMTAEWRALAGKWYAEIEWPAPPDDAAEREVVLVVYDAPEDAVSAVLLGLVRTLDGSGTRRRARFRIGELRARRAQELGGLVLLVGDPPYVELGALHDKAVPG
ncbi:MAG: hypothetical protein HY744_26160 [Deltaproteobacteria bacterium]|nr:hypothetical protein [Deltaproteobacteria bacterium]